MSALPRPAATVLVLRPSGAGPELYLVKRHGRSGFMAGAHVFPGGRVDDDDRTFAAELPAPVRARAAAQIDEIDDEVEAAAFALAAIRETAEECSLLLAGRPAGEAPDGEAALEPASDAISDEVFAQLKAGRSFRALLEERGLVPDLGRLAPFAWWTTPEAEPKRYDTRFFLAEAPPGQLAGVDEHEVTEGEWMRPEDALARYEAGDIQLAPPTLATLEDLAALWANEGAGSTGFDAARRAVRRPVREVCPVLSRDGGPDGGLVLALPGDPLHGVSEPVWPGRRSRFVLAADNRFASVWAG